MKRIVLLFWLAFVGSAHAQSFSLKEYSLGEQLKDCPRKTVERQVKGGRIHCLLGPTTFANQPAKNILLSIFEGRISSVMIDLPSGSMYAHKEIFDALSAKFGPPTVNKPHINAATWIRNGQTMQFDGLTGAVLIIDKSAEGKADALDARENKSDL